MKKSANKNSPPPVKEKRTVHITTPGGLANLIMPYFLVKINRKFFKMGEIEKIKRYINRTKMNNDKYYMNFDEACAMAKEARTIDTTLDVISLAFKYGKAKGYRAAKAEASRG